jgi:regulator of replication initiation timing
MDMSLKTWKAEFYNEEAEDATDTPLMAAQHSLKKWRGLTQENLENHGGEKEYHYLRIHFRDDSFSVDTESCALCHLYYGEDKEEEEYCLFCPMYKIGDCCEFPSSSYKDWYHEDDPTGMIISLEKVVEMLEEGE